MLFASLKSACQILVLPMFQKKWSFSLLSPLGGYVTKALQNFKKNFYLRCKNLKKLFLHKEVKGRDPENKNDHHSFEMICNKNKQKLNVFGSISFRNSCMRFEKTHSVPLTYWFFPKITLPYYVLSTHYGMSTVIGQW